MIKAFERFYERQKWYYRTVLIENELYTQLKQITTTELETSISKLIDACIDNFKITDNKIIYYKKPDNEITVKLSVRLRKTMWDKLDKMRFDYDISVQKLINIAIRYTLEGN